MRQAYKYDVFISHAYEDKDEIGDQLNDILRKSGLRVWYSGNDIRVGEDLTETIIHEVIPASKFGVAIISNHYAKAGWGRKELSALHAIEQQRGYPVILPVWHRISEPEVAIEFPYLAGRFAVSSEKGIKHVASRLAPVIRSTAVLKPSKKANSIYTTDRSIVWLIWTIIILLLFSLVLLMLSSHDHSFTTKPADATHQY